MISSIYHRLVLVSFLSALSLCASSQNFGVSFKKLFLDYQTLQGGDFGALKDYRSGFEFGAHFRLTDHLELNIPLRVGLASTNNELTNQNLYSADAQLHLFFISHPNRFKPYLLVGGGGVWLGKDSIAGQVPVGIGLDVKVAKNAYFNIQSEFRWSSAENSDNFIHGIGFKYYFAPKEPDTTVILPPQPLDTDGDGITDDFDACPTLPGIAAFAGCPDTDGDGVQDLYDECPYVAGLIELKGCLPKPDTDGDGIIDENDKCPGEAGLLQFNGCPDTDGDGIPDPDDRCPNVAGLKEFAGCPDSDKDGIEDSKDKCPHTYGPISNGGCPIIETKDREVLSFAMKAVQFELGKATLKPESFTVLTQIAEIMRKYPDYNLSIEGHTDNTGTAEVNEKLSESRAKACYDYLVQKGIPASRMKYKGYGKARPIADNSTYSGRTLNRRVEFNLTPGN